MAGPGWSVRAFGHGEHLARVAALFAVGLVAFVVAQRLLVPADFGAYGHYRPGALDDNRAQALVHAGREACAECHADVVEARRGSRHERIACEACHGPQARHAEDNAVKPPRPEARPLCARCHAALVGRPPFVPQVDLADHAPEDASCTDCHNAHAPGLGEDRP
jgi:hypothetical protein